MKATGTNTAHNTSAMAMIGPLTSSIARWLASSGVSPASMCRSTFSTTTMASSTTMPIASTRPKSDSVLIEKPEASITANVPTIEIGTAASGMIDARHELDAGDVAQARDLPVGAGLDDDVPELGLVHQPPAGAHRQLVGDRVRH